MSNEVINPYQTFRDDTGNVLANGTIGFYVNTTTTLDSIFSDEALTVAQENPYTLDAYGRIAGDVKYAGKKTLTIRTESGGFVRTIDNVSTSVDGSTGVKSHATLAAAVADTTLEDGYALNIAERTTGNGGGAMWDVVLSSTVTENTYNIVQCTGVGTLSLVLRMDGVADVDKFGADNTGAVSCTALLVVAAATGFPLKFGAGSYDGELVLGTGLSLKVCGAGRGDTTLKSSSGDVVTLGDCAFLDFQDMTVHSETGGGHCFITTVNSSQMSFSRMVLKNDNEAKSLWQMALGYCGNVTWEKCRFIPNNSATLTAHPFNLESTQIFNGWHIKDCRCEKGLGTLQFFNLNTSNASSFNTNCMFENITFQEPYNGWFKLGGCRSFTIDNCASYDQTSTQTGHGIQVGASAGGQISSRIKIKHCGRYPGSGGVLDTGISDIQLDSGAAANCVIESCSNSAAGATFTVDYANNKCLHIDRPSNSEASYTDASNVRYMDINGDFEGMVMPSYRTETGTSSRELTINTGAITPTNLYHTLDTEADAATDDLDTITATNMLEGDILTLRSVTSARVTTLKDGTGNLALEGDFALSNDKDTIQLLYNGSSWQEVARANNS